MVSHATAEESEWDLQAHLRLQDGSLSNYNLHAVPVTSMTVKALEEFDITRKDAERGRHVRARPALAVWGPGGAVRVR
jgi:hypothetical protein